MLDLLYASDLEQAAVGKGLDYSQRHENRARVKKKMVKMFSGKENITVESHENYKLLLSLEMRSRIESRLILVEDIQKVVEHAQTTEEKFINLHNGHTLAFFKPNIYYLLG